MTRVKICGLSRKADIEAVNEAIPDYIGFVFAPSTRQVSAKQAQELRANLAPNITPVGVFVNAEIDFIVELFEIGIIAIAQLHGSEDAAYINALKERAAIPVIKTVFPLMSDSFVDVAQASADYLLFDTGAGTGLTFDWSLLSQQQHTAKPWFLAGGVNLSNLPQALALQPWGIDVSSGVETTGIKDADKIITFVNSVRKATHSDKEQAS